MIKELYKTKNKFTGKTMLVILLFYTLPPLKAQDFNCSLKEPIINIDFGSAKKVPAVHFFPVPNYGVVNSSCPNDGNYAFISYTSGCFNRDWHTFTEDHTPNDNEGRMMVVNASESGGIFLTVLLTGLQVNTTYELAAWMINVCTINGGCYPLPPNIAIKLSTPLGRQIASFQTGLLRQNADPYWTRYSAQFTTPVNDVVLTMEDITLGGCGNDFALDDITIRECYMPKPIVKTEVKPAIKIKQKPNTKAVNKALPPIAKTVDRKVVPKPWPILKDLPAIAVERKVMDTTSIVMPLKKEKSIVLPAPKPILTRTNPVIKQIETVAGEMVIKLYDNGEIDGDTVSVYHNNELVVSRAALSTKAVTFRIKIDASHPHHELVMVANNLGSIPPNTSMMIITMNDKRHEVFISSSEQKNAKIVIDLKE